MKEGLVKLNKLNFNEEVKKPIKEIISKLQLIEGPFYFIKETENLEEGVYGFFTPDLSIYFAKETSQYFVSFTVGLPCQRVANLTKIVDLVLHYDEYYIIEDHYVDLDNHQMYFGYEAINKKGEDLIKQAGKFKCPVCEGVYSKKLIKDSGYCFMCDRTKDNLTWN